MPAILEKRPLEQQQMPEAKRGKPTQVQMQVNKIIDALASEDFEVIGSEANRQMLLALAPCILQTPKDVRNQHQDKMASMLSDVFLAQCARLKDAATLTQTQMCEADADMGVRKAAVDKAAFELQEKASELKERLSALAAAVGVSRQAEETLKQIVSELTTLEEIKELDVSEQHDVADRAQSFLALKEGNWESEAPKHDIKAFSAFFRKLKVDSSLVAALPIALGRKPEERSQFDVLTISELDKALIGKVEKCDAKVREAESLLVEKKAANENAESALSAAQNTQRVKAEALLQTRADHKQLGVVLADEKKIVLDGQFTYKAVEAEHSQKAHEVKAHQDVQDLLIELLEQQA